MMRAQTCYYHQLILSIVDHIPKGLLPTLRQLGSLIPLLLIASILPQIKENFFFLVPLKTTETVQCFLR